MLIYPSQKMKRLRMSEEGFVQKASGAADQSQAKRDQSMKKILEESGHRESCCHRATSHSWKVG